MGFGSIVEEFEQESSCEKEKDFTISKEELEAKSIAHYHIALKYQRADKVEEAIHEYLKLVSSCYIELDNDDENFIFSSKLKYLCLKNIGELYLKISQKEMALKFFIEALQVDSSKFELHSTVGKLALNMKNYHLARHSYEQAYEINPENLFCAKKYISILFIQENYELCLQILILLLEKNSNFLFGYVLLGELLTKLPNLKVLLTVHQTKIYQQFLKNKISSKKSKEILLPLYEERNLLIKNATQKFEDISKSSKITFLKPFKLYSWKEVGLQLLDLHNCLFSSNVTDRNNEALSKPTLFTQPIDFSDIKKDDESGKINEMEANLNAMENNLSFTSLKTYGSGLKSPKVEISDGDIVIKDENMEEQNIEEDMNFVKATNETKCKSDEEQSGKIKNLEGIDNSDVQVTAASKDIAMLDVCKDAERSKVSKSKESGKKPCKRKCDFSMLDDDFKRRSKRVKNSVLSSLNPENELNSIMKLLPLCFQKDFHDLCKQEERAATNNSTHSITSQANHSLEKSNEEYFCEDEQTKVRAFLKDMQAKKVDLVDMLLAYLVQLHSHYFLEWPAGLIDIFVRLYECLRSHFSLNIHLSGHFPDEMRRQFINVCLIYLELSVNENCKNCIKIDNFSDADFFQKMNNRSDCGLTVFEDLNYLTRLAQNSSDEVLESSFVVRVHWLNFLIYQRQTDVSLDYLQFLIQNLEATPDKVLKLPNCLGNRVISLEKATQLMTKLKKTLHVEDIFRMYNDGEYTEVIDIIKEVLTTKQKVTIDLSSEENREQMSILLNCYLAKKEHGSCLMWTIKCLSGYISHLLDPQLNSMQATGSPAQTHPLTFLYKLLNYIDVCMQACPTALAEISFETLQLLVASVCKMLEVVFEITTDANALICSLPCEHVIDLWVLLYRVLKWHYGTHMQVQKREVLNEEEDDNDDEVPGFMKILIKGHNYLARL